MQVQPRAVAGVMQSGNVKLHSSSEFNSIAAALRNSNPEDADAEFKQKNRTQKSDQINPQSINKEKGSFRPEKGILSQTQL